MLNEKKKKEFEVREGTNQSSSTKTQNKQEKPGGGKKLSRQIN